MHLHTRQYNTTKYYPVTTTIIVVLFSSTYIVIITNLYGLDFKDHAMERQGPLPLGVR
jgi:hypothetical protein